jgi:ribosome biogenesis GTPase
MCNFFSFPPAVGGGIESLEDFWYIWLMKIINSEDIIARVIAEYKGVYKVKNADRTYLAKVTGKRIFEATSREDYPAVGDWVEIIMADKENAVIQKVLPRKTMLKRKSSNKNESQVIATNIDVAFVIESVDRDFSLNRFERYFALARDGGVDVAIVLNKIDLITQETLERLLVQIKNRFKNIDAIPTSTATDKGLANLKKHIVKDKTYCFLGSSGVGKSSLINKLLGKGILRTEDISAHSGKGKHVTTKREMYFLENGGIVIDNPGMREVGMIDNLVGINDLFDEIANLADECKYKDCAHAQESGCAVLVALKSGKLDKEKYSNYLRLKKEAEFYELTDLERKGKDRDFGKFVKKAKKDLSDFGHKDYGR